MPVRLNAYRMFTPAENQNITKIHQTNSRRLHTATNGNKSEHEKTFRNQLANRHVLTAKKTQL